MAKVSRRTMLRALGIAGAAGAQGVLIGPASGAEEKPSPPTTYHFFKGDEAAFIEAAVARLIPADEEWGGAIEADVPNYIDKQLAGAWGAGERLYRSGPWQPGTPSQGYQLPFTPAELFRTAIGSINKELNETPFAKMSNDKQDDYLRTLEGGGKDLGGVSSEVFFGHLFEATLEGFFSDPVYGGNRNMVGWRMIGFPGAYASFYDLVDQHGIKITREPVSLADDVHGHMHMNVGIPAHLP
jgi:gluconate 2-dehydrogenase gamma chain